MFNLLAALFTLVLAFHPVLAGVYTTSPVGSSVATGGQVITVSWQDDGSAPTLASVGPCSVDIYTGGRTVQTKLQNLAESVNVAQTGSISATIDPTIGQNGAYYFIRFTSLSLKSTTNAAYPYEAFSSIFTINSMTGTFNSTILAQIGSTNATTVTSTSTLTSSSSTTMSHASSSTSSSKITAAAAAVASASSSAKSGALPRIATPLCLMTALVGIAGYLAI